jgi:ABC-type dipeptide/oligopeptide/nickel transport system permease component
MLGLKGYLLRRVGVSILALVGAVCVVFFMTRILPGNPAAVRLGSTAREETLRRVEHEMGLDKPLAVQFTDYLGKLSRGDLGRSWITSQPVLNDLARRLPVTAELVLFAGILAAAVGIGLGLLAAAFHNSWLDVLIRTWATVGASMPIFWFAIVVIYIFYFRLGWVASPMGRLDVDVTAATQITGFLVVDSLLALNWDAFGNSLAHLVLPVLTLAYMISAPIVKMVRANVLDVLNSDFVRTARSVGVARQEILFRDALRNALVPVVTIVGIMFGYTMASNVIVEMIFAWPGIGYYAWQALLNKDLEAIQGFVLAIAVMYVILNLVIDIIYTVIDPRVRLA